MLIEILRSCQVSRLSQRAAELEGQLDRAHRDKNSLTSQLEDTLRKLTSEEQDNTKVYWYIIIFKKSYIYCCICCSSVHQAVQHAVTRNTHLLLHICD